MNQLAAALRAPMVWIWKGSTACGGYGYGK